MSGRLPATADEVRQGGNDGLSPHAEPAAQIVPERDAVLGAGLGKSQEGIAAIAAEIAAGSSADLTAGDLAAEVVLGARGVLRGFPAVPEPSATRPCWHAAAPADDPTSQSRCGGGRCDRTVPVASDGGADWGWRGKP